MARLAAALALLGLLTRQEQPPIVEFQAHLERHLRDAKDDETRRRLERVRDSVTADARKAVFGDADVPEGIREKTYSLQKLLAPIQDRRAGNFWSRSLANPDPPAFVIDEPIESALGAEQLVDLLKERVAPGTWDGPQTLEKTPGSELIVNAPGPVHRQVVRFLRDLEAQACRRFTAAVWVFFVSPGEISTLDDGTVEPAVLERLEKQLKPVRLEATGSLTQLLPATSLRDVRVVLGFEGGKPRESSIPEGAALELRGFASGTDYLIVLRAGFRKVVQVDDVATPAGTLRIPRVVEFQTHEHRRVPEGRPVVLARLGPDPAESKHAVFVGRFSPASRK